MEPLSGHTVLSTDYSYYSMASYWNCEMLVAHSISIGYKKLQVDLLDALLVEGKKMVTRVIKLTV